MFCADEVKNAETDQDKAAEYGIVNVNRPGKKPQQGKQQNTAGRSAGKPFVIEKDAAQSAKNDPLGGKCGMKIHPKQHDRCCHKEDATDKNGNRPVTPAAQNTGRQYAGENKADQSVQPEELKFMRQNGGESLETNR